MANRITQAQLLELERAADRARDFLAQADDMIRDKGCPHTLGAAEVVMKQLITAADVVTEQ